MLFSLFSNSNSKSSSSKIMGLTRTAIDHSTNINSQAPIKGGKTLKKQGIYQKGKTMRHQIEKAFYYTHHSGVREGSFSLNKLYGHSIAGLQS